MYSQDTRTRGVKRDSDRAPGGKPRKASFIDKARCVAVLRYSQEDRFSSVSWRPACRGSVFLAFSLSAAALVFE